MSNPHWCTYCQGRNAHNCQFNTQLPRMHTYTTTHTAPPQRTWVGLTNDELTDLFYNTNLGQQSAVAQAIALLKERNT